MAELIKSFVGFGDTSAELVFTTATGSDFLVLDNADGRVVLVIKNTNTQNATVTLKAGDGTLAMLGDLNIAVGGAKTVAVPFTRVESARVKVTTGANKGKVLVTSTVEAGGSIANLSIAVLSVE